MTQKPYMLLSKDCNPLSFVVKTGSQGNYNAYNGFNMKKTILFLLPLEG
jgi:hypothetical protein